MSYLMLWDAASCRVMRMAAISAYCDEWGPNLNCCGGQGSLLRACFVQEDVEFCWWVGIAKGALCEGVLSIAEGECQLGLVIGVDRDCPEPWGDVQCGKDHRAFDFWNFLVQLGHRLSWQGYLLVQLAIVDSGPLGFRTGHIGAEYVLLQSMCGVCALIIS